VNGYVPSRRFVESLASFSWVERTTAGPVAMVLLGRADSPVAVPALNGLADGLRLGTRREVPDCGPRVGLLGLTAALRVDRCRHAVQVPVGRRWAEAVRGGARVGLVVGLAPLRRDADRAHVADYLAHGAPADELRMGTASLLTPAALGSLRG
jgi:hypothetical protein